MSEKSTNWERPTPRSHKEELKEQLANTNLLVHAVNTHAGLKKAVALGVDAIEAGESKPSEAWTGVLTTMRAALAAAEEEV